MEQGVSQIVELGRYGVIGVMLGMLLLIALLAYFLWKMACNHIQHSNDAFNRNTEALTKLTDIIDYKLK